MSSTTTENVSIEEEAVSCAILTVVTITVEDTTVAAIEETIVAIEEAEAVVATANHSVALSVVVSQILFKHSTPVFFGLFRLLSVQIYVDCIYMFLFFLCNLVDLEQRSPDWKHDMYDTVDDAKPSSTTPI